MGDSGLSRASLRYPGTPQELQIARLVGEGKTDRDVAATLFITPKTVEFHLTRVYRKLEIHSRSELVRRMADDETKVDLLPPKCRVRRA